MKTHRAFNFIFIGLVIVLTGVAVWKYNGANNQESSGAPQQQAIQEEQPEQPSFNKQQYSLDDPASIWVVVNKQRPLSPIEYTPQDLAVVGGGQQLRSQAASAYKTLLAAASEAGFTLAPESGYRSYGSQTSVYNSEVNKFGRAVADTQSARPGHSEHQTGWAIDIGVPGCFEDCFAQTPAAAWLKENAYKYGFVIRYQEGKDRITGYRPEAWHARFVGAELATELNKTTQTMEEFFGLPAAPNY